jgi:hypothetical protein
MAKTKFTGISESYIFDEAGGMRDQLEQTILNELNSKRYPLKASISTIKASGGGLLGALGASKEQCVVIQVDNEAQIAISNTTVGTYLYVEVYLMIQEKFGLFAGLAAMMDNAFKQQKRNAYFVAAKAAAESAFSKLNLKQSNSGYKSNSRTVTNDD